MRSSARSIRVASSRLYRSSNLSSTCHSIGDAFTDRRNVRFPGWDRRILATSSRVFWLPCTDALPGRSIYARLMSGGTFTLHEV